jgi:hypothetical protein
LQDDKIKEDEMGRRSISAEEIRNSFNIFDRIYEDKSPLGKPRLSLDVRIILK